MPHHLIDIRDPSQAYSAAEFAADAHRLVREINARGKLALLVGGTMLYFKAWYEGLDAMPPADPAIRAEIEAEAASARLARHARATGAGRSGRRRRAWHRRIRSASSARWRCIAPPAGRCRAFTGSVRRTGANDAPLFSLEPQDRCWLHQRIAQRFDAMLAGGFLAEVQALRERGDLTPDLPSMRCVGYRQAWELLDEHEASGDVHPFPMHLLRERGIAATRQLAKRQLTWLRSMPQRRVIECDAPDAIQRLLREVREALG